MEKLKYVEVVSKHSRTLYTTQEKDDVTIIGGIESGSTLIPAMTFISLEKNTMGIPPGIFISESRQYADPFTMKEAMAVQTEQVEEWGAILKPEVYNDLVKWVQWKNRSLKNGMCGFDVPRGTELQYFVHNYVNWRDKLMADVEN